MIQERTQTDYISDTLAVFLGAALSAFLSAALVLVGLRAGITPGVSPLVVLVGWMLLAPLINGNPQTRRRSRFLVLLQTTASSGAAVTAGVIFTAPILQIATPDGVAPAVQIYPLLYASVAGALLGWACVGLTSRRMLYDFSLPAPEAVACDQLLQVSESNDREKRPSLLTGLLVPSLLAAGCTAGLMMKLVKSQVADLRVFSASIPFPVNPLYLGIGAILSLETALLLAAGGFGHSIVRAVSTSYSLSPDTFRWVGAGAMTVSILYTLGDYLYSQWQSFRIDRSAKVEGLNTSQRVTFLVVLIAAGVLAVSPLIAGSGFAGLAATSFSDISITFGIGIVVLILALLLSAIGALLSLQVGSSSSPVSGTVFVGMLLLTILFTLVYASPEIRPLVYLLVTLCVAVCAANDSSQDYRTLILQGYPLSWGYFPQLVGLLAGVAVVPTTLWVAHESFYLGSAELPAPQASFFSLVLLSLLDNSTKPFGAIASGVALGIIAVATEVFAKKKNRQLSSVSFCVGLYLPPSIGVGILLGALARFFGQKSLVEKPKKSADSVATKSVAEKIPLQTRSAKNFSTSRGILAAAVFISMDAAVSLGFGISSIFGYWHPGGTDATASQPVSVAIFLLLLGYLYFAFLPPHQKRR